MFREEFVTEMPREKILFGQLEEVEAIWNHCLLESEIGSLPSTVTAFGLLVSNYIYISIKIINKKDYAVNSAAAAVIYRFKLPNKNKLIHINHGNL
jgi:hypothetical protein